MPSSPSSVDWDWGERRRRAGGVSAGGVTAPPTTSQTVGGSEGEGYSLSGLLRTPFCWYYLCLEEAIVSEGRRRASRLSRGRGFFVVCVMKKNQVEGLKIILLPAIKSKFMAL